MKHGSITSLLGGVIVAGFSLGAFAELKDNPYSVIVYRNPFALKAIVPPPPPPDITPPPPPPMEIKLTGITTLLGPPRVFLEFTDPQTKKVDVPPPFGEGDPYKDNISIFSIDAENQTVTLKIGDKMTTLDFEKDGKKAAGATASATPVPHPGFNPGAPGVPPPAPVGGAATSSSAARGSIVSGQPTAAVSGAPGALNNGATAGYQRQIRTDSGAALLGGGAGTQQPAAANPQTQPVASMSREEIEARIEAQRRILQQQNHPGAVILPPTGLGRQLATPPAPGK